jgi:hypothetical protein
MRQQAAWRKPAKAITVQDSVRSEINQWAARFLARFEDALTGRPERSQANHPIEVFSEWRGLSFYLCTRYEAASGRPEDRFVVRFTRLHCVGNGKFDLSYFRHTERWWTVLQRAPLAECLKAIEQRQLFWPIV